MRIGIPRETSRNEHRVGLTPFAVQSLCTAGNKVYVEHEAGTDCLFSDDDYTQAGAKVVYNTDEVFGRADLVCRIGSLTNDEIDMLQPNGAVCGFLQLAVAPRDNITRLIEKRITAVGYELVERKGRRTVLVALAEIAGRLAIHSAAHLLQTGQGGRGLLLGGVPGIPPATVVVLGAGTGGLAAAKLAAACGAHVIILDADIDRLRQAQTEVPGQPATSLASERNISRFTAIADVLVGAALTPGASSSVVVTEKMVERMKPGSVIYDMSIGLGGCIETSRPTTLEDPTFQLHGVTHFCVPNMTAAVPRTASRATTASALPYLTALCERGVDVALREDQGLARGIYIHRGKVPHPNIARLAGVDPTPLAKLFD